jgi:hypothetical protein
MAAENQLEILAADLQHEHDYQLLNLWTKY